MWHNNKNVTRTFISSGSKNSYVAIEGVGWRRIKPDAADGVTNLTIMMNVAKAHGRTVNVNIDGNNQIDVAYLN